MSLFERLKSAIFGTQAQAAQPPAAQIPVAPVATPDPSTAPRAAPPGTSAQGPAAGAATAGATQIDIAAVLDNLAAKSSQKLDWRSSIVDLMKLVNLDPSLENRKTLAGELGYRGDTQDTAAMNVWLHEQVMHKLADAGGRVPDSLKH